MHYALKIRTKDAKGLIYRIVDVIFKYHINIIKNNEFVGEEMFFFRTLLEGEFGLKAFVGTLETMLGEGALIGLHEKRKKDIVIFATKESHCLGNLLTRHYSNELEANVKAVISNHNELKDLVDKFNTPYHLIGAENTNREEQEGRVLKRLENYQFDYLVLARYMRISSPNFMRHFEGRIINIHHSFLPAFIGTNPYKQAFERGVKVIGATAHFVNNNLDEGLIITQDMINTDYEFSWKQMQEAGRNVEENVLSRALDLVFEDRIFIHKNKAIIF